MDHSTCYASVIPKGFILSSRWFLLWVLIKVRVKALNDIYGTWYLSIPVCLQGGLLLLAACRNNVFKSRAILKLYKFFLIYSDTIFEHHYIYLQISCLWSIPWKWFFTLFKIINFLLKSCFNSLLVNTGRISLWFKIYALTQPSMCSNKRKSHCLASFPFED